MTKRIAFFVTLSWCFSLSSCQDDFQDIPLPIADFQDIVINLTFSEYTNLQLDGEYYYYNDSGIRGIIIYRESATEYYAYERNCAFNPGDACATVEVHSSGLFMTDPCCGSNYNFPEAFPSAGPARSPLRIYETLLSGTILTITDNSANGR